MTMLKEPFSLCDQAFGSLTDANAFETFLLPQGQYHSKAGLLMSAVVSHSNEEYGFMTVYLRLKGIHRLRARDANRAFYQHGNFSWYGLDAPARNDRRRIRTVCQFCGAAGVRSARGR